MEKKIVFLKNYAGFYDSIEFQYNQLQEKKNENKDPYEHWSLDERLNLISVLMSEYLTYIHGEEIRVDEGKTFIQTLNKKVVEANDLYSNTTDYKTQEVYLEKLNLVSKLLKEYKIFIKMP